MTRSGPRPRALAAAFAIALLLAGPAAAQAPQEDLRVLARADASRIGEGDSLSLTIEATGPGATQVEEPDLSGLADFTVAAGPSLSTSTSMVWSGGQATSRTVKRFTYVLMPRRRGTLSIPSFPLKRGSRILHTEPLSIEVVAGSVGRRPPAPRQAEPLAGGRRGNAADVSEGDLFVEAFLDRKEGFVGEQFLLTYRLFTRVGLVDLPGPKELPAYTGFWVEEIPSDPRASLRRVVRDGRDFTEIILMKKALFPTASGSLVIEPTVFGIPVKAASNDPFEGLFFTPTRTLFRQTLPITVTVRPLPEAGRPASFSGAVGRYKVEAVLDRSETQVSEAVGLKVAVTGEGNIRLAGQPALPPLADFRTFEPRVEESSSFEGDRLHGARTWEYVLTPLAAGAQSIPPIRFSWFDPKKGAYVEGNAGPLAIVVKKGSGPGPGAVAAGPGGGARREVRALGRDIAWIKPDSALDRSGGAFHRSSLFAILMAAPVLLNTGLWLFLRRRQRQRLDVEGTRLKRAPRFARRRLAEARRALATGDSRRVHEEVGRALAGYLGDTLGVSPSGLTRDAIEALLQERGVPPELRAATRLCLDQCDSGRYSPEPSSPEAQQRLLDEAGALIGRLAGTVAGRGRRSAAILLALLLAAAAPATGSPAEDPRDVFRRANEAYAAGRFEEAARGYEQVIAEGAASPAVHYNLANARYRLGSLGQAVLHYEKALRLDPGDPETRANLEFARSLTVDRTSPAGAQTPAIFLERMLALTSLEVDAAILCALWVACGALVFVLIAARAIVARRVALWGLALLALPLAAAAGMVAVKGWRELTVAEAVVLRERLDVMSGPGGEQAILFTVHEGLKVRLEEREGGWARIVLPNGLNGWIPLDAAGEI